MNSGRPVAPRIAKSGTEVKLDGVEYMIMKESDLMGVLVEAGGARKAA
jgi:chaperonin GroES